MSLCKYADIFGAPRTGVHSYRVFDIAIVDYAMTVIAALVVHHYLMPEWNAYVVVLLFQLMGIIAHRAFCVKTKVDQMIFG
jgi:hypothetical protein